MSLVSGQGGSNCGFAPSGPPPGFEYGNGFRAHAEPFGSVPTDTYIAFDEMSRRVPLNHSSSILPVKGTGMAEKHASLRGLLAELHREKK